MFISRNLISLRTAVMAAILLISGCATPFPERLNWYGEHPALYTMAFRAAAEEALVKARTGQTYYQHMGDTAYTLSTTGICNRQTLETYIGVKERGCHLFGGLPAQDCLNANACVSSQYDRELFSDPELRRIVEAALRRPCDFLTPPDSVPYKHATVNFGMSVNANWRILQCGGAKVYGSGIVFDDESGTLSLHFSRGS
jgi:hypothetical protein